jgi:GT2 family glycosyltransferase
MSILHHEDDRTDYRYTKEEVKGYPAIDQPLVYVVVLNWNLKEDTAVLRSRFPQIKVLGNKANLGYAGGSNRGIQYAMDCGAAYILLVNNDTIIADDMIQILVDVVETDPAIGIAGPAIFHYDSRDRLWYLGHQESRWLPVPRPLWPTAGSRSMEVDYLSGCGMLIRRALVQDVGLLDERYFMYYEDADFCRRARKAGYRVVAVPKARMWHKVSRSSRKDLSGIAYIRTRNRMVFYQRHLHGPSPLLTGLYLASSIALTAARAIMQGQGALAFSLLRGWYDGCRSDVEELSLPTGTRSGI